MLARGRAGHLLHHGEWNPKPKNGQNAWSRSRRTRPGGARRKDAPSSHGCLKIIVRLT